MSGEAVADRVARLDWDAVARDLAEQGHAHIRGLLTPAECAGLIALYSDDARFRRRVDMARYRFGEGDYAYFAEPLPALVADLRHALYARLAPMADAMMAAMGRPERYPATLDAYRARCAAAGQTKPTPLLLRYRAGGYNCLHRDLYGDLLFPLQGTVLLNRRSRDFEGGEFLLVENRPRQQARGEVIVLDQGDLILFPVNERPVATAKGTGRAAMRHGVSRVRAGERYTLGIIFHDAA